MKIALLVLTLVIAFSLNAFAQQKPIVVLVPGFSSSLAPGYIRLHPKLEINPYFSKTIVETFESQGFEVRIPNHLAGFGTLEGNGERLLTYLHSLQRESGNRQMILVAHSAGGFYSLYALSRDPSLPITTLLTIATPFLGADVVDHVGDDVPLMDKVADLIDFRSLQEFRRGRVANFLRGVRVPKKLNVIAVAPSQPAGGLLGWTNAKKLSWPMVVTQKMAHADVSDGIVTTNSSFGLGLPFVRQSALNLPLEHWEQVLDYRIFTALGVRNVGYIKAEQQKFYLQIARNLSR